VFDKRKNDAEEAIQISKQKAQYVLNERRKNIDKTIIMKDKLSFFSFLWKKNT